MERSKTELFQSSFVSGRNWWRPTPYSLRGYIFRLAFVFLLYFAAGELGLAVPFTSANVSPVWPAAPMVSDVVRQSYPVIFGRALNFSLPPAAEGPSIEAEIGGQVIVFPLGPDLFLRWADCHIGVEKDQSRTYRCELKPGYQFQ